uniref:PAP-associated domain-containing protein n=1 Tax=Mesocestoides corti TaxID=53468 RepID=A0A5K3FYG1_MESCO
PVIPTDFYESTVSLAGQTDPTQSGRPADLEALLSSLPKRSFATLRHVMQHVGFILCHQRVLKVRLSSRLTRPDERQKIDRLDDPRLVLNIFSQSLLRPPWRQIVKLASADNNYKHLLALERVFEYFVRPHESGAGGAGTSLPLTTRSVSS